MTPTIPPVADDEAMRIAAGLTKAQRSYLTVHAERPGTWGSGKDERLYTFPPSNTHAVLIRLGLVGTSGCLQPLALRVRAALQNGGTGDDR